MMQHDEGVHFPAQVAIAFAGMHDTPTRMVAKGVLRGVVPWARARPFFVWRLRRRYSIPMSSSLLFALRCVSTFVYCSFYATLSCQWF